MFFKKQVEDEMLASNSTFNKNSVNKMNELLEKFNKGEGEEELDIEQMDQQLSDSDDEEIEEGNLFPLN